MCAAPSVAAISWF